MTNRTIPKTVRFFQDIDDHDALVDQVHALREEIKTLMFRLHLRSVGTMEGMKELIDEIRVKVCRLKSMMFDGEQLEIEIEHSHNPFIFRRSED